jgi:flavin reductase (DIM6/NTAB) family NADH-FMN oxidoreductase RutF
MEAAASSLRASECYALLTSIVVPRPIAWVSTRDPSGHTNLAPFSYFTGLGSDPPMITIGISNKRDGSLKDTLRIAKQTGVFCINLVEEHDAQRMNASSGEYAPDVSEIDTLQIDTEPCVAIDSVRVKSARAHLECKLVDVHPYGRKVRVNLVVGEIVHFHVADELLEASVARASAPASASLVKPLARLGDRFYAKLGERVEMLRPKL